MINIGWPEGIFLALAAIYLLDAARFDGQDRRPHDSGGSVVEVSALVALLFWGGFFS